MLKQIFGVVLALALVASAGPTWADSVHIGNTTNNTTNNHGGQGGQGGAGGTASATGGTHIQTTTVTPIQNNTQLNNQTTVVTPIQNQTTIQGQGQGQDQDQRQKQQANNEGNHQSVNVDVPRQAPPAVAPGLSVSSLSCYGTWGIGASSPFGGVSAGFPTLEEGCHRARVAMVLQSLGEGLAAVIYYADGEKGVKEALAKAGRSPKEVAAAVAVEPVKESKPVAVLVKPAPKAEVKAEDLQPMPVSEMLGQAMREMQAQRVAGVEGN